MSELTQEYVRSLFDYKDGHLYWKAKRQGAKKTKPIGCLAPNGYMVVGIDRKIKLVHRIVFLYHHGYLPPMLDHINTDKQDNRIENLRPATSAENNKNKRRYSNTYSKHKNVYFNKKSNGWYVMVASNGKSHYFGFHKNLDDAVKIAHEAREKLHKEFCKHD